MTLINILRQHRHATDGRGLRGLWRLAKRVLLCADTTTIRILLANASLFWVLTSFADPEAFSRPVFYVMRELGSQQAWQFAFLAHFLGSYWRLIDSTARPICALVINGAGFLLWFTSTVTINIAMQGVSPGTAIEWSLVLASAWALFRTGLSREMVTP